MDAEDRKLRKVPMSDRKVGMIWALILLAFVIWWARACIPEYVNDKLEHGWNRGLTRGYEDGFYDGYEDGHEDGHRTGYARAGRECKIARVEELLVISCPELEFTPDLRHDEIPYPGLPEWYWEYGYNRIGADPDSIETE